MSPTLALSFLEPLAGVGAAAVAIPALLLLYFLRLRRRPLRVSSVMFWERAAKDLQVNAPFQMIRLSWLLLLQLLAVALLCAALARPALDDDRPPEGRVAILIDASASMSARDEGNRRTRLEDAQRAAVDAVDSLDLRAGALGSGRGSEAMVLSFAATPRTLASFTASRAELRSAIERVEATDQPADLGAALRVLAPIAGAASEEGAPLTVLIFSDGDLPIEPGDGALGADVRFVRVGPEPGERADNVAITAIGARRDEDRPSNALVFARFQNAGGDAVEIPVVVRVSGERRRSETVTVGAAADRAGEAAATFSVEAPDASIITVSIEREDALGSDNEASVALPAPQGVRIVAVAPGGTLDPSIREGLRAIEPRSLRVISPSAYSASAGSIGDADVLVFDRVRPETVPTLPSLSFASAPPIPGLTLTPAEAASITPVVTWLRTHPVMRGVTLDRVEIARPFAMGLPSGAESGYQATALAHGLAGPLIAMVERGALRHIVVGFDVAPTDWWIDVSFPLFLINAVEHLAGWSSASGGSSHTTSDSIAVRARAGATRIVASRLGGTDREVVLESPAEAGQIVPLGVFPEAGVRRVTGVEARDAAIAVNMVEPRESELRTSDEVGAEGAPLAVGGARPATPREIWPWFVLGAFILMTAEWWIYAWRMRS